MARNPVHLEMVGGQSPRQRIWLAIRELADSFTLHSIARKLAKISKVDHSVIRDYVKSLERAEYIENINPQPAPHGAEFTWKLVRDNGIEAPRLKRDGSPVTTGLGTEAMWRTMRFLGDFDAAELSSHASTGSEKVAVETAKTYIRFLSLAGYIVLVKEAKAVGGKRGAIAARHRMVLSKYSGPRPPMIQRTKSVYDPNLGRIVWQEEPDHDF